MGGDFSVANVSDEGATAEGALVPEGLQGHLGAIVVLAADEAVDT